MKPNFALTLSFEGIGLLHRAFPGWHLVGEVPLDSGNLAGDLADLRDKAALLDPSGLRCKLVIPEDQIKYLRQPIDPDRDPMETARAALEGATPYAVDELAIDVSVEGDTLLIAAVARETLAEADAFASEYAFGPVGFVAAPESGLFAGEPFFGPASAANGEQVDPDLAPVRIIGAAKLPDPAAFAHTETEDAAQAVAAAVDEAARDTPKILPVVEPDTPEPKAPEAPVTTFASIRAARDDVAPGTAPKLAGASRDVPPALPDQIAEESAPESDIPPQEAQTGAAPPKETQDAPEFEPAPGVILAEAIADPDVGPDMGPDAVSDVGPVLRPDQTGAGHGSAAAAATGAATPAAAPRAGFFSRRSKTAPAPRLPAPKRPPDPKDERQRMTVFGAREPDVIGGKPRYLGLILTAALLLFLVGVAAWASIFMDEGLSRFFQGAQEEPRYATLPVDEGTIPEAEPELVEDEMVIASLTPQDGAIDTALQEALSTPSPAELTPDEARARYAATGIWQRAPESPLTPDPGGLDEFYLASVDPTISGQDAIALPEALAFDTDLRPQTPASPPAPGTRYRLDGRGFVQATPEGALTPEGVVVYAGRPAAVPAAFPRRAAAEPETGAIDAATAQQIGAVRPKARPGNLGERIERGALGGFTRSELAALRPKARPKSAQEAAAAAEQAAAATTTEPAAAVTAASTAAVDAAIAEATDPDPLAGATAQAVRASLKPKTRPKNFAKAVARAQETQSAVAVSAKQRIQPSAPTVTSVAKQATQRNVLSLRKVNLIGVYGTPSARRALVRLSNGRYKKVKVGDRLDGGKVAAIGDSELRYVKNGRSVVLKMPKG